jgi:hypothetical protein
MAFTNRVRGITSRRITDVTPPEERPSAFAVAGGWGPAADPVGVLPVDPATAEANARAAGAHALTQFNAQQVERARAARDRQLAGVALGHDFSRRA